MRACITTLCLLLLCPHLFESLFHVFIFCISVDLLIFFFLLLSFVLCYFAAVYIFFPTPFFLVLSFYLSYLFICGSTIHHHQRLIFFEIQSSKLLSERLIFNMFLCTHFVMCLHVRIFFEIFYPFSIFYF